MKTLPINGARFSRKAAVRERFQLSDPQLFRLMAAGIFPNPVYFGPRSPRWRNDELDEFEQRAKSGEIGNRADASAATAAARASYAEKAANGEIGAKRRATAERARMPA